MNNTRSIFLLLAGSLLAGGILTALDWRARAVATVDTRATLCTCQPEDVTRVEVRGEGVAAIALARGEGGWMMETPFSSAVEEPAMARLLDALTLQRLGDMRTEADVAGLGESVADFGLDPARVSVTVWSARGGKTELFFGKASASGTEIYARVAGLRNVFTMPAAVLGAVPTDPDAYRRRAVLDCTPDEMSGLDFRAPDRPQPVRLVRGESGWRLTAPVAAAADETVVAGLVEKLVNARAVEFVLPSAQHPPAKGEAAVPAASLSPYGLAPDVGFSVTVRTVAGGTRQIVFGAPAGTNRVWALAAGGAAVVTLPSALAEECRVGVAALRDARIFPVGGAAAVEKFSIAADGLVYVLVRGTNSSWRLEAPVIAPADAERTDAFVGRMLRLKSEDASDGDGAWKVSLKPSGSAAYPGVCVPAGAFAECGRLADLRSKTMLVLPSEVVRRIVRKPASGAETRVALDASRGVWQLDAGADASASVRTLKPERVASLLAALAKVEAASVETVAATPDDFRRCGLEKPFLTITADVDSADAVRWNLMLGDGAPGGGRYATVGGADAIFILGSEVVTALSVELAE